MPVVNSHESHETSLGGGGGGGAAGGMKLSFPFSFKVLQMMTGFGIGCGVGIGIGRPINVVGLPVIGQMAGAFSDVSRSLHPVVYPLRSAIRKSGMSNLDVGLGCGVGIGHGFGIGLALKPHALSSIMQSGQALLQKLEQKLNLGGGREGGGSIFPKDTISSGLASPSKLPGPVSGSTDVGLPVNDGGAISAAPSKSALISAPVPVPGQAQYSLDELHRLLQEEMANRSRAENQIYRTLLEQQSEIKQLKIEISNFQNDGHVHMGREKNNSRSNGRKEEKEDRYEHRRNRRR